MLVQALRAEGLSEAQARQRIWAVDRDGLILSDMTDLSNGQRSYARDTAETDHWVRTSQGAIDLFDTVANVHPTVLIGASGQHGAFSEAVVRTMAQAIERPVIFPLSNPVSRAEAHPADLARWSAGRALIGTGSPFGIPGVTQVNNIYIFPGVGLGALAAGASEITDTMFMTAARTLGAMGGDDTLLPPIERLRDVALDIAVVVAAQAVADGVAASDVAIDRGAIASRMWVPTY